MYVLNDVSKHNNHLIGLFDQVQILPEVIELGFVLLPWYLIGRRWRLRRVVDPISRAVSVFLLQYLGEKRAASILKCLGAAPAADDAADSPCCWH
jgi:hypothetical protein